MGFFIKNKFDSLEDALIKADKCKILNLFPLTFNLGHHGYDFARLINLKELYVHGDWTIYDMTDFELPHEIGGLKNLQVLSFLNVPIRQFPSWTTNLPKLRYLMLRGTDVIEIPEYIDELKSLKTLRIENCALTKLPFSLRHLDTLEKLLLCDTQLTNLDPSSFPKNLKSLDFSGTYKFDLKDLEKLRASMPRTSVWPKPNS